MEHSIRIFADAAALCRAAADVYIGAAKQAVAERNRFTVALAGGSTPKALYALLATDGALRSQVPWRQTYFFFGDERHVPPDDPQSNYRMAREAMLSKAPVDSSQVFRMKAELGDAAIAAAEYEQALRGFFALAPDQSPRFDLVMLGMGVDGHTASLFPGSSGLQEQHRLVSANWVEKLQTHRITLTLPVLNNAATVMFMVQGADKAEALKAVVEPTREPLPAQLVHPQNGTLLWLVDEAAAALLDRSALLQAGSAAKG
jgi:6-phosphogluconolactonase